MGADRRVEKRSVQQMEVLQSTMLRALHTLQDCPPGIDRAVETSASKDKDQPLMLPVDAAID